MDCARADGGRVRVLPHFLAPFGRSRGLPSLSSTRFGVFITPPELELGW